MQSQSLPKRTQQPYIRRLCRVFDIIEMPDLRPALASSCLEDKVQPSLRFFSVSRELRGSIAMCSGY